MKFQKISQAREYLLNLGYRFSNYGHFSKNEIYTSPSSIAMIKRTHNGVKIDIRV